MAGRFRAFWRVIPSAVIYVRLAIKEKWSKRDLERQLKATLFERSITRPVEAAAALKKAYSLLIPISHKHHTLRDMACERLPV